jgi:bifunctional non-homologous end joining protein LigD
MRPPEWFAPMAATLTQDRFTGPEWIFERKFDGIRLLAFKRGADVQLFSRTRRPQQIPALAEAIATLPVETLILDGEVTWDRSGAYHVFDIIWIDDRDLRGLPLEERRALLETLPLRAPMRRVAALHDPRPWERACAEGWEGVIAKRRDSRYEHRRSPHWMKMKCEATQEFVVGGFTDPQGGRQGFGALLVGHYQESAEGQMANAEKDFVFAGKVGTGFDTKLLLALRARLDAIEIPKPPFTKSVGLPRVRAHWVRPEVVVQVAFIEWTVHGKLRHPRLLAVTK